MLVIDALTDNLEKVTDFVYSCLEGYDCPIKTLMQIDLGVEEIFVNIASYAYEGGAGKAEVSVDVSDGIASITLADSGKPYNPLEKADPDITLPLAERDIGGYGIFITKKAMDEVYYDYKNGHNILTMVKRLPQEQTD